MSEKKVYDEDKKEWYSVRRSWWGNLKLVKVVYEQVIVCLSGGDVVYSDADGLNVFEPPPEPPTPQ